MFAMGDNLALANKEFIDKQDGPLASPGGDFLAYEKIPQSLRRNFSEQAVRDLETFPLDWPVS